MSLDSLIAVTISSSYQPSMYFIAGLLGSVSICLMTLVVESSVRLREINSAISAARQHKYQQFRHELVTAPRHVGFIPDVLYELDDHEFHVE